MTQPANPSPVTAETIGRACEQLRAFDTKNDQIDPICNMAADLLEALWASKEAGDKRIAELERDVEDLKHDIGKAIANLNAEINK